MQLKAGKRAAPGLVRAPYLAYVDLAARAKKLGADGEEVGMELVPQIVAYWTRFQSRSVVHVDLQRYLELLSDRERAVLLQALEQTEAAMRDEVWIPVHGGKVHGGIDTECSTMCRCVIHTAGAANVLADAVALVWPVTRCPRAELHGTLSIVASLPCERKGAIFLCTQLNVMQVGAGDGWKLDQIRIVVNAMRIKHFMGTPSFSSVHEALAHVRSCTQLYNSWRLATENCSSTEFGVGEEAVEMAVGALVAAFGFERHLKYIVQVRSHV
jgi:hypothetical protein